MMESRGLPAFTKLLAATTLLLVAAGGLVTSTGSGLSVPDWPTSYGWNMFTFPISKWVGNIKYEHVHRLIASTVGLLTIVLVVWTLRVEERRPVKILSVVALAAVIAQGILGGLTVKYLLPTPISVAHACLAQTFFCLTVAIACVVSPRWRQAPDADSEPAVRALRTRAVLAFSAVCVQLVLGAWMRHSDAGLAIPDFPASFGKPIPDHWNRGIALAFAHRAWALVAAAAVLFFALSILRSARTDYLRRAAVMLSILVPVQFLLGTFSIWTLKAIPVTVGHVAVGALLLASTAVLTMRVFQVSGAVLRNATAGLDVGLDQRPAPALAGGAR